MVSKVAISSNLFNHLLNLFQMLGTNLLFSWFSLKVKDSVLVALHSTFCFDMSQLNFNNFWTDWAMEPGLDSKDASFRAVSEYDFIELRFYNLSIICSSLRKKISNSSFFWIKVVHISGLSIHSAFTAISTRERIRQYLILTAWGILWTGQVVWSVDIDARHCPAIRHIVL